MTTPALSPRRHRGTPSLCEVNGFLRAASEAMRLRPDLPREAFIAAARSRSAWFARMKMCDAATVIEWAALAMRRAA